MEKVTMTTNELVKAVAGLTGKTQKEIKEVIGGIEDVVKGQLGVANENCTSEVKLLNGLTLISEYVAPRQARNPQTGEAVMVAAHKAPKFKFSTSVKSVIA